MRQYGSAAVQPVDVGKRVLARLLNSAVVAVIYLLFAAPLLSPDPDLGTITTMSMLGTVLSFAVSVTQIVLLVTRSATIGHMLVKVKYLKATTGEDAKGQILLRYVVSGAFEGVTLGLGAISYFFTYRDGQHWLDRAFGTVGVVRDSVRSAAIPPGPPPGYPQGGVMPVRMPGGPAAAPAPAPAPVPAPSFAPPPTSVPAPAPEPMPAPASFAPPAPSFAAPAPSFAPPPSGFASSSPGFVPAPASPVAPSPSLMENDATVLDPEIAGPAGPVGPTVVLDDGTRIVLDGPVVLGRNPLAPAGYPGARCIPVVDTSMRVSKTHLVLVPADGGVTVVDLGATNGLLLEMDGMKAKLAADQSHALPANALLHFGGRSLRLDG